MTLFTDGSCVQGNPGSAGSAYVLARGGKLLECLGFPLGRGTNNEGELTAAACGFEVCLQHANKGEDILLVSDSLYLLQGLQFADRTGADPCRPNNRLWRQIYEGLVKLHEHGNVLRTYWVKGHNGNDGNILCDILARTAARLQTPQRLQAPLLEEFRRERRRIARTRA